MKKYFPAYLCLAVLFSAVLYAGEKIPGKVDKPKAQDELMIAGFEHVGKYYLPHGWGAGLAKKGDYLYVTKGESHTLLGVFDVSDTKNPKLIGYPFEDNMGSVHFHNPLVEGNLLIGHDLSKLVPFDISDPKNPKKLQAQYIKGVWSNKSDPFVIKGKYFYYAANSTEKEMLNACILQVYEIQEPFQIRQVASLDLTPYLSEEAKTAIVERSKKTGPGSGWNGNDLSLYRESNIIIDGDILHIPFVMSIFGVDVSDPLNPKMVYKHENGEQIRGMELKGKTLFVTSTNFRFSPYRYKMVTEKGLSVIDISDPENVRKVSEYRGMEIPQYLELDGNRLYVIGVETLSEKERKFKGVQTDITMRMMLHVLDVSNPSALKFLGAYRFTDRKGWFHFCCQGLIAEKNHLYVGDPATGLLILNVEEPSKITEESCVHLEFEAADSVVIGNYMYVQNHNAFSYNLYTFDIRDPENPKLVGQNTHIPVTTGCHWFQPGSELAPRRYLYMPSRPYLIPGEGKKIVVLDLKSPGQPEVDRLIPLPGKWKFPYMGGLVDWKDYVLLLAQAEQAKEGLALLIFKKEKGGQELTCITELPLPGILGTGAPIPSVGCYCVQNNKVYIITLEKSETGEMIIPEKEITPGRAVATHRPDVTLTIVDIADLSRPAVLSTTFLQKAFIYYLGIYGMVTCRGNYLYILGEPCMGEPIDGRSPKALYIYDVSNSKKPKFVSDLAIESHWCGFSQMTMLDPYPALLIQEYARGLCLVDISDPRKPALIWRESMPPVKWGGRYPRNGWNSGTFRDGYLYINRIPRIDVFKAELKPKQEMTAEARNKALRTIIEKAQNFSGQDGTQKSEIRMLKKTSEYYLNKGNLQIAEEWANLLSQSIQEKAASYPKPEMIAVQAQSQITVDGKNEEWKDVSAYPFPEGKGTVKLQWDDKFLYFLFDIQDSTVQPAAKDEGLYTGDGVELYLNTSLRKGPREYGPSDYQYVVSSDGRMYIHSNNPRFGGKSAPPQSRASYQLTESGYRLEVAISHEETWIYPGDDVQVAWICLVNDKNYGSVQLKYTGDASFTTMIGTNWPQMKLVP